MLLYGDPSLPRKLDQIKVYKELIELHKKYGVNRFSFWDDNFLAVGETGLQKAKRINKLFSKHFLIIDLIVFTE